jgi:putative restriction endonuclease
MWAQYGRVAPHKPLLALYALGQFARGKEVIPFQDVDRDLSRLLKQFGPKTKSIHTEYPFWRLQNDGLWCVTADAPLESRKSNTDAKKSELLKKNARGGFPDDVKRVLRQNPGSVNDVAKILLEMNFPGSLHEDILDAVGLAPESSPDGRRRDPEFRRKVLRAYEFKCCVCGYDFRLGDQLIGVEAAHIKWWQAGGPDVEQNGLALCTLHHKAFDLGAFTVCLDFRVAFSQELAGSARTEYFLEFHGRHIRMPQSRDYWPSGEYLNWHLHTIFRSPRKDWATSVAEL